MLILQKMYFKIVFVAAVLHGSLLQLLLEHGDFLNIYISQGSVATCLRWGGIFEFDYYKFATESNSERILKVG